MFTSRFLTRAGKRSHTSIALVEETGVATISYLISEDTLVIWLMNASESLQVYRRPAGWDSIAGLVRALRQGLGADDAAVRSRVGRPYKGFPEITTELNTGAPVEVTGLQLSAHALAELLLPLGLRNRLRGARELVIIPHGPLALVPFAVLPIGGRGELLGGQFALSYAPSLESFGVAQNRPRTIQHAGETGSRIDNALVVANPAMPSVTLLDGQIQLVPLLGAEVEGGWVAERLGVSLLSHSTATEDEIRRRLPGAPIVHIATHGYAYPSELRTRDSFVALAPSEDNDGLLTVGDVLDDPGLRLSAEVVVLSACQTGLGDVKQAEGTIGFQRAFLAKGARSVLVSLWNVSDEATTALMKAFYTHWLDDPDHPTKAEALRRAQLDVRSMPGFEHPLYWAAFQLVGAN